MKYKYYLLPVFGILFYILFSSFSHAADFNILPGTGTFGVNKEAVVNIKINTAGATINAAQAVLSFNPATLEVKSISKDGSVFNFWLQEPKFSNSGGTIEFIAGTANGVSGSSLQVLQVTFTTKGVGSSDISFTDSSIAAADGSGTNILSNSNGAKFTISSSTTIPAPAPISTPVPITRKPTQATGLPAMPIVDVPLYPDPNSWYNFISPLTASWKLPTDISGIGTALNADPTFVPATSEGLFESKTFPAISRDGIYYLHVRFKNSIGWGPALHYRMAVDSQPPISFKIDMKTGMAGDDPSPAFSFATTDALSGIDHYEIFVNSAAAIIADSSTYTLLPQPPGEYKIRVKAIDKAGNGVEDSVKIEILPIETPIVNFINQKVIIGTNDILDIKGSGIPNASIIVSIEDSGKRLVLQDETKTDTQGVWEFRLDKELRLGDYFVTVKARDSRGALSLPTNLVKVSFVEKPIISLFGLDITLTGLIFILIIIGGATALWFYWETLLRWSRTERESTIINRDLKNAFDNIRKDLNKMSGIIKKDSPTDTKETEFNTVNKKIKETLDMVENYSSKDIENLK